VNPEDVAGTPQASELVKTKDEQSRQSPWRRAIRRFIKQPAGIIGLVAVSSMIVAALLAPWLAPYDPLATGAGEELLPPSLRHLIGTDHLGRDLFSRMLYGARVSLLVGVVAVGLGATVGISSGLAAGYGQGRFSNALMRVWDVVFAIPTVLLAIALVAALGTGTIPIAVAIGIGSMPVFARIAYSATAAQAAEDYVEAAEVLGLSGLSISVRHVLPNILGPLLVQLALAMGVALLLESGLSYLGLGTAPPAPSWGGMLATGRQYMRESWWYVTFPGLAITLVVVGLNAMADALRDAFDPRGSR
jgi:peptide/nickel transport system permease protein